MKEAFNNQKWTKKKLSLLWTISQKPISLNPAGPEPPQKNHEVCKIIPIVNIFKHVRNESHLCLLYLWIN